MSKIYFGIIIMIVNIKSFFLINYYRFWGLSAGSRIKIWGKPIVTGYLNNIKIGNKCRLEQGINIIINKEGGLKIGNNTLISTNVTINSGVANISIGNNVMIAANSYIINNDHDIHDKLSVKFSGHISKDIVIKDNVWIGANVTILKGVTIGEGAIIGAGSVVTKDISPYSINVGSPCKYLKNRFDKKELLIKLREENYDDEKINLIFKDYID